MNKLRKIIFIGFFFLGTFYLLLPAPRDFPPLPQGVRSTEPGDTIQIPGVSAYYTDLSRQDVLDFYTKYFSKSLFWGFPLLTYRLNHPPERIREVLRSTQQSTYVEEIVHPFRESVFVNGFEWNNDPFTPPSQRVKNILIVNSKTYQFKITLFYQESKVWLRLIIFYFSLSSAYLLSYFYGIILDKWKKEI